MKSGGDLQERSIITVLSADIVGSTGHIATIDPDDAQIFFDRCFDHLRGAIEAAGGLLVSYEGDGGIAVFGWPGALEDHAEQACTAAWTIQHSDPDARGPTGAPLRYRVGVHSGLVGLRQIRRRGRSRFNTVGAAVNIAAKLQKTAAPGTIVVSEETINLCSGGLELSAHQAPDVEGAPPVRAFQLHSRPQSVRYSEVARRYPAPIVGRAEELALLRTHLPRAGGQGASIAVIGEAGIGKSRLVAAVAAEAEASSVRTLVFYGDAQKLAAPFAPARALVTQLLRLPDAVQRLRLREALTTVGIGPPEIDAVATLFAAPKGRSQQQTGSFTLTQVARALRDVILTLVRGRSTLLLIEDLHLIDQESRQFLRLLAEGAPALELLLVVTGRPEAMPDAQEIAGAVLRLEPMPRRDMLALGRRVWPSSQLPSSLIDNAVDRADGIPFVLEELARSAEAGEAAFNALPQRVESVIHARLRRLPRRANGVARALSLLGEEVDVDLLRAVTGIATDGLLNDLAELERFALVHPIGGGGIRFRHQIIAEACANTIPRKRRMELHQAAIAALVGRTTVTAGRQMRLAFHAEGAGDDRAALSYLWEAAVEARGTAAAASLNMIFDRALDIIARIGGDAEKRYVDFVLMVFPSMLLLGEFDKMRGHLPRVMELARRHGRPDKVANGQGQLGMLCWFEGRYEEGLRATEEGLATARTLGSPALIFANQLMLANVLHGAGRIDRALAELESLLGVLADVPEAERWGSPAIPRSTALSFTGWIMIETGRHEEALAFAERGMEVAVRLADPYSQVMARNALGRCLLLMGRNQEAAECLAVAREIADTNGYDATKANLTGHMATALARIGRASEAITIAEECLSANLHLRTGQMEVYCLKAGYAEALVRVGRTSAGLAMTEQALVIARDISNPCLIASGLRLRARLVSEFSPGDSRIAMDYEEASTIGRRHGLVAMA
jgi:class 3 adenylate cyclase/tetratricopeptide (TPR) repeat protein